MSVILVIDDNEDYRTDLMELLELQNYATLGAENGKAGLQMIHQHSPDLILCDVDMPIMNGIEVLSMVKADPVYSKIPFIVVTSRNDNNTLKTAHDLGAETTLSKLLNIDKFLDTIVYFLSNKDYCLAK